MAEGVRSLATFGVSRIGGFFAGTSNLSSGAASSIGRKRATVSIVAWAVIDRGLGVSSKMPVRSPALAAMAIDDIAQGSGHDILDATAQAAAAVSLAHGLCPIRHSVDHDNNAVLVVSEDSILIRPR